MSVVQDQKNENENESETDHIKFAVDLKHTQSNNRRLFEVLFPKAIVQWFTESQAAIPPLIDIGTRNGNTNYHDHFLPNELPSSVVWFIDKFKRLGLAFRMKETTETIDGAFVYTLFQRYSDGKMYVACECHKGRDNRKYTVLLEKYGHDNPESPWYLHLGEQDLNQNQVFKALIEGTHPFCMLI